MINNKKITIITMIYKSAIYLDFIVDQIKRFGLTEKIDGYDIDYVVVANDATQEILDKLNRDNIKHLIYNDPNPQDYYLKRVYRAWNYGAKNADCDILLFVNSDMAFSPGWIGNLLKWMDKDVIPCSLLIESGRLPSMSPAISTTQFGQSPEEFKENEFLEMANRIRNNNQNKFCDHGLFMPSMFFKEEFIQAGGFPEGNIYKFTNRFTQEFQLVTSDITPYYGKEFYMSGDAYFFYFNMKHRKHITVFDSVVFHIQEGELRS